ncbi:MAG: DNA-directed RNA polymerase subunit alpha C-terminal domain-containing protein [Ruminococcus sp.]
MVSTSKNVDDSENKNDIDETPFHNDFSMLHFSSLPTIEDATYEVEHARLEENNIEETPFLITPNLTKQPIEENPKTVHVEKKKENAVPSTPEQYNLNISVQDLPLSLRSRNGLCRGGIMTLRQLLQYDKESLLGVRNLGKYSIKEITDFLATTFHH